MDPTCSRPPSRHHRTHSKCKHVFYLLFLQCLIASFWELVCGKTTKSCSVFGGGCSLLPAKLIREGNLFPTIKAYVAAVSTQQVEFDDKPVGPEIYKVKSLNQNAGVLNCLCVAVSHRGKVLEKFDQLLSLLLLHLFVSSFVRFALWKAKHKHYFSLKSCTITPPPNLYCAKFFKTPASLQFNSCWKKMLSI